MRPAHQAREVSGSYRSSRAAPCCFNEARASSAGSNATLRKPRRLHNSFNEARASSAGSNDGQAESYHTERIASMRPAHQAREVIHAEANHIRVQNASMRPAHQAREVRSDWRAHPGLGKGFNEARASSAGSNTRNILVSPEKPMLQ